MAHKPEGQMSFADRMAARRSGLNAELGRIDQLMDWEPIVAQLESIYAGPAGRPSYPLLVLFKSLLLQQWHQLSDRALEAALADRLSFMRFVGLTLADQVPDHSTLSRFRSRLAELGVGQQLLHEVNRQLEAHSLMVKQGTLIDASLVAANVNPPRGAKGKVAPGDGSLAEPEAQWTRRGRQSYFGYKLHVAADQGSDLIRKGVLTGAKINDSEKGDELICGDEQAVYADKGYDSDARRQLLARHGIADGIMRRAAWGTASDPDPELSARNRRLAPIRAPVERIIAVLKRRYGLWRARYRSLRRNQIHLSVACICANLRRARLLLTGRESALTA
jgi:transposase, IS5 family